MINLRYHIVSLTAVFLAIGIGLTLGSTFLDRATVDNLNGQLDSLADTPRGPREPHRRPRGPASDRRRRSTAPSTSRRSACWPGDSTDVPVVVVAAAASTRRTSGLRSRRSWSPVPTSRDCGGSPSGSSSTTTPRSATWRPSSTTSSTDPSRLRRSGNRRRWAASSGPASSLLPGREATEVPTDDRRPDRRRPSETPTTATASGDAPSVGGRRSTPRVTGRADIDILLTPLTDAGFISSRPFPGVPTTPTFPDGTRCSWSVGPAASPTTWSMEPLVERMSRATSAPVLAVAGSALGDDERGQRPGRGDPPGRPAPWAGPDRRHARPLRGLGGDGAGDGRTSATASSVTTASATAPPVCSPNSSDP